MRLRKIWDYLRPDPRRRPAPFVRLAVEALEDRTVLSTASGLIGGIVYLDAPANGMYDAADHGLSGASVSLVGTGGATAGVNLSTTTDSAGQYAFRSLVGGSYQLTVGPINVFVNSGQTFQSLITLADGQAIGNQNVGVTGGLGPQAISLALLFNTATSVPVGTVGGAADNAPVVSTALGSMSLPQGTTGKVIDLAGFFSDPDYTNSQVKFNLSVNGAAQSMTVDLFDASAPQTVANFFDYVVAGDYDNTFFNRKTSVSPDGIAVLQGGALTLNGTGTGFTLVPEGPEIPNEFGASNTQGTIAMAQSNGDPNSATNQFFFNTSSNATQLDPQDFTVFGKLADAASSTTLTNLAATPVHNLTNANLTHDFPPAGFNQIPLNSYTGNSTTFPGDATLNNYLIINSIDILKRDEFLTYTIVSNSNPGLVAASINHEFLTLNAATGQTGSAQIVVRATDRFGAFVEQTLTVTITAAPEVTAVAIAPDNAANVTMLTATPTATALNANPVTFTYQWLQNGFPLAGAMSQTLILASIPTIEVGDTFSVEVTPSEMVGTTPTAGATFTSAPRTVATVSPVTLAP